jgi:N-acetylmuramoyl-L-alanine amidase
MKPKTTDHRTTHHNYTSRRPQMVVVHYTAGDDKASLVWLTQSDVSSHYLIQSDGTLHTIVDEEKRAWHAGISHWRGFSDVNSLSIGVELSNPGYWVPELRLPKEHAVLVPGSEARWIPFQEVQIQRIGLLLQDLKKKWAIPDSFFLGHSDVAPDRKIDPGPLFPWKLLHDEYHVGAWHDVNAPLHFVTLPTQQENKTLWLQQHLRLYGYPCPVTGELTPSLQRVLQAFQMHFRPSNIEGSADEETLAILASLVDRYVWHP